MEGWRNTGCMCGGMIVPSSSLVELVNGDAGCLLSIGVNGGGALLSCCVGYRVVLCVGVIQGC